VTLLSITQAALGKIGLPVPSLGIGNADVNVSQMIALINEEGQELGSRHSWQVLTKESNLTTTGTLGGITELGTVTGGSGYASGSSTTYNLVPLTGGTGSGALATISITSGVVSSVSLNYNSPGAGYSVGDVLSASNAYLGNTGSGFSVPVSTTGIVGQQLQGLMTTLAGADFNFIVNETMWDRTTRRPIFGPKSPAEWQQLQAQFMQGPWIQYRIRGGQLLFLPAPTPGDLIYFEWVSKYWCTDTTGVTGKTAMTVDTDVGVLDERLLTLGGVWRFKKAKGLDYAADEVKYEMAVTDAITRDGSRARLNLAGAQTDIFPGIVVPAGNWGSS